MHHVVAMIAVVTIELIDFRAIVVECLHRRPKEFTQLLS
jgi:hypothetical protein